MYGIIRHSETLKSMEDFLDKKSKYFGRTSIIRGGSLVLRLNGLLLYENFGGSNSIRVRTSKA